MLPEKVNITLNDVGHKFDLLCTGEDGLVEVSAQEGSQLHKTQRGRALRQHRRQSRLAASTLK